MKPFRIYDDCWEFDLWVICPANNKVVDKFIYRHFGIKEKTRDGTFKGRFVEVYKDSKCKNEWAGVLALRDWNGKSGDYDVLAHECLHAVRWFLSNRGIKLCGKTDEAYCYLLGSLVRRILEQLNKGRRK